MWNRCGIVVESLWHYTLCYIVQSRRRDEVTVNQEADDHHLSCSCPCSRHRGAKSPKCQITEVPKHRSTEAPKRRSAEAPKRRSASCSCRCPLTVNRSKSLVGDLNSSRRLFGASKAARGRCLEPQQCLEQETRCLKEDGASALWCLEEEQEQWWSSASWLTVTSCLS
jgi:hypothetical protein